MFVDADTTLDDAYAALRRTGTVYVHADRAASVVSGLRRRAKADGLLVSAYRGSAKGMSRQQARQRSTSISLTRDGVNIVAPDGER